jgi:hypothetical protein
LKTSNYALFFIHTEQSLAQTTSRSSVIKELESCLLHQRSEFSHNELLNTDSKKDDSKPVPEQETPPTMQPLIMNP